MKILELFSGIGGFAKGFQQAGFEFTDHYFSEIDKHAIANYKYNFPNAKHIGSVTDIPNGSLRGIDIITFGSPCQDFSLAGKRKGLEGDRSSLIREAIRLIADIRPGIFIWENVKGAFSSNAGEDFWAILQAFTNIGGYRLEWQLLNTRWFLPQNRERIYLVGHLETAGRDFKGVFPIGEDEELFTRTKKSKEGQPQTKYCTTIKPNFGNKATDTFIEVPRIAKCLTGGGNSGGLHSDITTIKVGTYRTHKDGQGFREIESNICPTIPARARIDGSGMPVIQQDYIMGYTRDSKGNVTSYNRKEIANTLHSSTGGGGNTDQFVSGIRRLTEIECERLQGFPDDWTKYGNYDGVIKEIPKTQRYKMLGNAVTVNVVETIARRLKNNLK